MRKYELDVSEVTQDDIDEIDQLGWMLLEAEFRPSLEVDFAVKVVGKDGYFDPSINDWTEETDKRVEYLKGEKIVLKNYAFKYLMAPDHFIFFYDAAFDGEKIVWTLRSVINDRRISRSIPTTKHSHQKTKTFLKLIILHFNEKSKSLEVSNVNEMFRYLKQDEFKNKKFDLYLDNFLKEFAENVPLIARDYAIIINSDIPLKHKGQEGVCWLKAHYEDEVNSFFTRKNVDISGCTLENMFHILFRDLVNIKDCLPTIYNQLKDELIGLGFERLVKEIIKTTNDKQEWINKEGNDLYEVFGVPHLLFMMAGDRDYMDSLHAIKRMREVYNLINDESKFYNIFKEWDKEYESRNNDFNFDEVVDKIIESLKIRA